MSDDAARGLAAGHWFLSGRVQGVGFRWFVLRQAERYGIRGWTRNLVDGRVEVVAAGWADDLAEFQAAISSGPRLSRVDNVEKADVLLDVMQDNTFVIK